MPREAVIAPAPSGGVATASDAVRDALAAATVDDELAAVSGTAAVAEVLVRRAGQVGGVAACGVLVSGPAGVVWLAGAPVEAASGAGGRDAWSLDEAIESGEGAARLRAIGSGADARAIVAHLCERARRWSVDGVVTRLVRRAVGDAAERSRLGELTRHAALGRITGALVHDLASIVQIMHGSVHEVAAHVDTGSAPPPLQSALDDANDAAQQLAELFAAMRQVLRGGEPARVRCALGPLVQRARGMCAGWMRSRAPLRLSTIPAIDVLASEPLLLQILIDLLRRGAEVTARRRQADPTLPRLPVDLLCHLDGPYAILDIIDDGAPASGELIQAITDPLASPVEAEPAALGLATAADLLQRQGGLLTCAPEPGRGTRFTLRLPLA
jgi:signal transduction histidine kinase